MLTHCASVVCYLTAVLSCFAGAGSEKPPGAVTLFEGDSLILRWTTGLGPLVSCKVQLPSGEDISLEYPHPPRFLYIGEGLRAGHCGINVTPVRFNNDSGQWALLAQTTAAITDTVKTNVTVLKDIASPARPLEMTVLLGGYVEVICGPLDVLYCQMTDPQGRVTKYSKQCAFKLEGATYHDQGHWTCRVGIEHKAIEANFSTLLIATTEPDDLFIGHNETQTAVNLFCESRIYSGQLRYCSVEPPNQAAIMLTPGRGRGRYSYYGINPHKQCGVTILKPLTSADYGSWKCLLGYGGSAVAGGYITLAPPKDKSALWQSWEIFAVSSKAHKLNVLQGLPFSVKCHVRAIIKYCLLTHPNGTVLPSNPWIASGYYSYDGDGLELGDCGLTVRKANISDSGKWICTIGVGDVAAEAKELQTTVDVVISNQQLLAKKQLVTGWQGEWTMIGCSTLHGEAITYCRFHRPDGYGFRVDESSFGSDKQYMYRGGGFRFGDCTIFIAQLEEYDFGKWTCVVQINYMGRKPELVATVLVREPDGMPPRAMLWIAIGVVITVILLSSLIACRVCYPKLRHHCSDENVSFTSETALTSIRNPQVRQRGPAGDSADI